MSQSLCGAEVLTSSFSATSPHQDTVAAFYEVLNVTFFYAVSSGEIRGCSLSGSVSLVVTSWFETVCTGELWQGVMTACKISFECVIFWVTRWSLILYFIDQRDCGCLRVNCEPLKLLILSAEKKENLNFTKLGFLCYCKMFHCFVDTLNRLMSRLFTLQRYCFRQCLSRTCSLSWGWWLSGKVVLFRE